MNIEELIYEVYRENDDLQTEEEVQSEVTFTLMDINCGNYTSIFSEIANALVENKDDVWMDRLEKLVKFQRYGVKEINDEN